MRQTVTVEPYLGTGAYGPQYGPAVVVKCFLDDSRKLVRAASGSEVISETRFFCDPHSLDITIVPESRVTIGSRTTTVLSVKDQTNPTITPDHLEVSLR